MHNYEKPTSGRIGRGYNYLVAFEGTADISVYPTKQDWIAGKNAVERKGVSLQLRYFMLDMQLGWVPTTWLHNYLQTCAAQAAQASMSRSTFVISSSGHMEINPAMGTISVLANQQKTEALNCSLLAP